MISVRLISREKMTVAMWWWMAAERAMSSPSVELCVGTIDRVARYRCDSWSISTQRTGTEGTGTAETTYRRRSRGPPAPLRSLCTSCLRLSRNTSSAVVNVTTQQVDVASLRPRTFLVETPQRYPRLVTSSRNPSARTALVTANCTLPPPVTVPSLSSSPARSSRRWRSDPRR